MGSCWVGGAGPVTLGRTLDLFCVCMCVPMLAWTLGLFCMLVACTSLLKAM